MYIKTIKALGIATLSMTFAVNAFAVAPGGYGGFMVGMSNTHNKNVVFDPGTFPPSSTTPSNTGIGFRFFMGNNINQYFGLEGGITHFANTSYSPTSSVIKGKPLITENAFDLVGKGILPLGSFSVFAKAGMAIMFTGSAGSVVKASTTSSGVGLGNSTTLHPTASVGAGYDLTQNWVVDLSATQVFGSGGVQPANLIALGISYHFVDKYCGQFLC